MQREVTCSRKWQSEFKLRSVLLKSPSSCKLPEYFEQNQKQQVQGGHKERLEITLAAKSQGKDIGVKDKITEDQLKL